MIPTESTQKDQINRFVAISSVVFTCKFSFQIVVNETESVQMAVAAEPRIQLFFVSVA